MLRQLQEYNWVYPFLETQLHPVKNKISVPFIQLKVKIVTCHHISKYIKVILTIVNRALFIGHQAQNILYYMMKH